MALFLGGGGVGGVSLDCHDYLSVQKSSVNLS